MKEKRMSTQNNAHDSEPQRDHISLTRDKMYFVSDLHIGDGSQSEPFYGNKDAFIQFLNMVRSENAQLVIVGDGLDFHQAMHDINSIITGNSRIITQLIEMESFHYIRGNHDYELNIFQGLLHFELHQELVVDNKILIQHGYEYDPYISRNFEESNLFTIIHNLAERIFSCKFRLPLENFYNFENRCAFWMFHKFVLGVDLLHRISVHQNWKDPTVKWREFCQHWAMNQIADPANLFENIRKERMTGTYPFLLTGHSHLPGQITFSNGKTYVNTGSWTYNNSQYAVWDGTKFEVKDFRTGKIYDDRMYQKLNTKEFSHLNFLKWWQENYMGWLRFRNAEERRFPFHLHDS